LVTIANQIVPIATIISMIAYTCSAVDRRE
jgi:hypothetical protein